MKTTLTTIAFLLSLLFILSSCGVSTQENAKVRFAYLQNDLHHLPAFVALEKGFFQQEGLSVEVAGIFRAGPELMSGFAAGSLDIGYVGLAPAMVAAANKTAQVKIISLVNKNGSAIVVSKGAPFTALSNLKGKIIAIPGHATIQDFLLRKALLDFGVDDHLLTIITIKPPEMISTLESAQIDAFIAWEPYPAMTLSKGIGKVLIYSKDIWYDHPCCVVVVSTPFIEHNPLKVVSLLNAHRKSIEYIKSHYAEAVSIAVKYTGVDSESIERALCNIQFDHRINVPQTLEYCEFLNRLGYTAVNAKTFIQSLVVSYDGEQKGNVE